MYFYHSKHHFIATLMVSSLLNACTTEGYYAPVTNSNNESFEDRQVFLFSNQSLNKSNPIATSDIKKRQVISHKWATQPMDSGSNDDHQNQALWNNKSPPYNMSVGIKIKNTDSAENITSEKKQNIAAKNLAHVTNQSNTKAGTAHKKQPTKPDLAQKQKRPQKKSITLVNDKKSVKLNFGWPIKGKVLKSFSPSNNKGIDIAGQQEQSVKATEAGTVVYAGQGLIGFGKLLIIKHNGPYLSAYANNSQLLAKEGQVVKKGQVIAEVGNVGFKRISLHFEIRKNGKPVNPLKLLLKK